MLLRGLWEVCGSQRDVASANLSAANQLVPPYVLATPAVVALVHARAQSRWIRLKRTSVASIAA